MSSPSTRSDKPAFLPFLLLPPPPPPLPEFFGAPAPAPAPVPGPVPGPAQVGRASFCGRRFACFLSGDVSNVERRDDDDFVPGTESEFLLRPYESESETDSRSLLRRRRGWSWLPLASPVSRRVRRTSSLSACMRATSARWASDIAGSSNLYLSNRPQRRDRALWQSGTCSAYLPPNEHRCVHRLNALVPCTLFQPPRRGNGNELGTEFRNQFFRVVV